MRKNYALLVLSTLAISCSAGQQTASSTNTSPDSTNDLSELAVVPSVELAAVKGNSNGFQVGYFAPPVSWPLVAVHASTLPNGKVLTWAGAHPEGGAHEGEYMIEKTTSAVDLWNPATNTHTRVDNTNQDLFCSGHTLNADGLLIVTGGNNGVAPGQTTFSGAKTTFSYYSFGNRWTQLPDMADGRWYPTATTLANGEVITMGGMNFASDATNFIPEVLQLNKTWRLLNNANIAYKASELYPWNHVAPNGQLFNSGPRVTMGYLDTEGEGQWSLPSTRDNLYRFYGTSVMYGIGKLLVLGGLSSSAEIIDLNKNAQVTPIDSMKTTRTFMNATLLPNGEVFVNGGNTDGDMNSDTNSVYSSEIWNPNTTQWSRGASATVPRNYHSTSLLLPDGRVLTTGSRMCGPGCTSNHLNAEIYYPPYLFKKDGSGQFAVRPKIVGSMTTAKYGNIFSMRLNANTNINRITMIRMGSTTHAFNMDQRFLDLNFIRVGSTDLRAYSPTNANIAPPGYYMVFAINDQGVPSQAAIIRFV
jgi:hypothetical protein